MKKPYHPISCHFHDELELLALRRTPVNVVYLDTDNQKRMTHGLIRTIQSRNKEEFLILDHGLHIRLDRLVSVNDKYLQNYC